jgi:glycolate oxidase FAD binding subunit
MSEGGPDEGTVAGAQAVAIERPGTLEELRELVSRRDGRTLVPSGGRTQLELGNPPREPFTVVDVHEALGGEARHERDDMTAVAPAGITLDALQRVLEAGGQRLPLDPGLPARATLGGVLAVGYGGPLQSRFGLPRDIVLGLTLLRPDGELVKAGGTVVKNVAGYDLVRLACGSLGTLGVITSAALRVVPLAETVDVVAEYEDLGAGLAAARAVYHADARPEVLEFLRTGGGPWVGLARAPAAAGPLTARLFGGAAAGADGEKLYAAARDLGHAGGDALVVRLNVLPAQLGEAVARVEQAKPSVVAVRPLAGLARAVWRADDLPAEAPAEWLSDLRRQVETKGGNLVVERMPPAWRSGTDAWGAVPAAFALMKAAKEAWDPDGRLNRGRFVGGL